MKKSFLRFGFQTLLAMVFLLGGLLFAGTANGQTIQSATSVNQGFTWKSSSAAEAVLKTQITFWHGQMTTQAPNTAPYNNAHRKAAYYKGILQLVMSGESVQQAATLALNQAATMGGSEEAGSISSTDLRAIYAEAKQLLKA